MKLRTRLALIIALMTTIVIAAISTILLRQASALQTQSAIENTINLAYAEAILLQREFEVFMSAIDTVAKISSSFNNIDESGRREYLDNLLLSSVAANTSFIGMYSVWRPGVVGGGSSVYSTLYTRENSTAAQDIIERHNFAAWNPNEYNRCQAVIAANDIFHWMLPVPVPFVNRGRNVFTVFLNAPIVDNKTGEFYGIIGTRVDITPIQEHITNLVPYGTGQAQLISAGNIIAGCRDSEMIGKDFHEFGESLFGSEGISMIEKTLKEGSSGYIRYRGNIIAVYPIQVRGTKSYWTISVEVPFHAARQMMIFTIVFAIVMVLVASIVVSAIINFILRPLLRLSQILKDISQGEGDLTLSIPVKGNDVIADIGKYFNQTLVKIKNMVLSIKKESTVLSDIGNDLASNMNETAAAVHQIAANVSSIKERVKNQTDSVNETNATMERLVADINQLDGQIKNQSANISQASSAIEEMVANIRSVTETLVKNGENVKTLMASSEVGRAGLQDVSQDIQEIARESEGLLEINSVMENIASQTNLLSMNAAIEAAHAGEAGKGFAVVADEIRKLAENSSEQSKTIGTVLKKIKESIDKITQSTENVLSKFEAIDSSVKTVADQEDIIRNAMEEQGIGSKQILEGVSNVNEITRHVTSSAQQMLEEAKRVIQESKDLERQTHEINSGMSEMVQGTEQINIAVHHVNEISSKNREGTNILIKEVSRFKVE
jgi:methyl-accepting chemotaxis protein